MTLTIKLQVRVTKCTATSRYNCTVKSRPIMQYRFGRHITKASHTLELRVHGRVITLRNVPTKGVKFEAKCFEYITWRLDVLRIRKYIHVVGIFKNLF